MLFNSFEFALFLPLVFLLYWFVFNRNLKWQNFFVVVVSYLFYGWWDWRFLLLIAFTTFCSWLSGVLIERYRTRSELNPAMRNWAKLVSGTNIILNLGILGVFKYFNFFVASFVEAFASAGIHLQATTLHIVLLVGISFYTFQALSYSIDVYRKQLQPTKDIVAFFAYVSFFPQLVAGPIERATNLLPQFYKARTFDYTQAVDGMRQMLWGFFKKIVIADNCAVYVNQVFDTYQDQSGSTLLLAAVLFALQIYGDFSGYSDIAIGTSRLFGFNLMRNFNFPYFSRDIAEFWRRWHISLTTWFRDYLYIPLGGSRVSKAKVIRNTFIIFLVSGFWHGANWTFVVWGAFHALLFLPLIVLDKNRKNTNTVAEGRVLPSVKEFGQMVLTFGLVVIGWVFFRADTITEAFDYLASIMSLDIISVPWLKNRVYYIPLVLSVFMMFAFEWIQRTQQFGLATLFANNSMLRRILYLVLGVVIYFYFCYHNESNSFIYFQF
ncbi:MAG: Peptidoglycan O-acetyltransferase [Bacteroidetes bacterium ADurb.Bin302]|nr:MAG: Peptidoglycan O-acetyltransferase [Bacteroidetes bacterium ADurb.Bin302]